MASNHKLYKRPKVTMLEHLMNKNEPLKWSWIGYHERRHT